VPENMRTDLSVYDCGGRVRSPVKKTQIREEEREGGGW